jgi:TetR/AcrR family transcriptional regulator of autoinduction and epiphytic fitness
VYNHFESKEQLFEALVRRTWEHLHQSHQLTYDPARPLGEQLAGLARRKMQNLCAPENMRMFRTILAEFLRDPGTAQGFLEALQGQEEPLVDWLQAAHRDGRLRVEDPARAAGQFWALVKGEVFWGALLDRSPVRAEAIEAAIKGALDLFLCRYRVGEPEPPQK